MEGIEGEEGPPEELEGIDGMDEAWLLLELLLGMDGVEGEEGEDCDEADGCEGALEAGVDEGVLGVGGELWDCWLWLVVSQPASTRQRQPADIIIVIEDKAFITFLPCQWHCPHFRPRAGGTVTVVLSSGFSGDRSTFLGKIWCRSESDRCFLANFRFSPWHWISAAAKTQVCLHLYETITCQYGLTLHYFNFLPKARFSSSRQRDSGFIQ